MKISVVKKGRATFQQSVNFVFNTADGNIFDCGGGFRYQLEITHEGLPVYDKGLQTSNKVHFALNEYGSTFNPLNPVETAVVQWLSSRSNFINRLQSLTDKGIASAPQIRHERDFFDLRITTHWVVDVDLSKLSFPTFILRSEKKNHVAFYGSSYEIPEIEVKKSCRIRPTEWFEGISFGNEHNGGIEYYVREGAIPYESINISLEKGYELIALSAGHIDGWGCGFKGGAYIVKKS